MEIKCPMYMWDGFSGHRKACRNVIYTVLYCGEQFPFCVCHTYINCCLFSSITEVLLILSYYIGHILWL